MVKWLGGRNRNKGVFSSNPALFTIKKTPLTRKGTGSHFIKSTSLEKTQILSQVSAVLEIEYATQFHFERSKQVT